VRSKSEQLKQWSRFHQAFHPRPSASERGYDADWKHLRNSYIKAYPDCRRCGERATVVDHVQSIREAPERRLDPANLMSLCTRCHNLKSQVVDNTLGKRTSPA
jgi:5-methylcytosine-specific restriction endonuclease McrA